MAYLGGGKWSYSPETQDWLKSNFLGQGLPEDQIAFNVDQAANTISVTPETLSAAHALMAGSGPGTDGQSGTGSSGTTGTSGGTGTTDGTGSNPAQTGTGSNDGSTMPSNPSYTLNPTPTEGQGAYGMVPGQLGLPNPSADLASVYPNLSQTNAEVSQQILRQLRGELSPDTIAAIQDSAAAYGLSSGMPGSGLAFNRGLRDVGLQSEALQQQGIQNFQSALPTIASTQTVSPELQSEIALQNAINAAAPNPTEAANAAQALFNEYLNKLTQGQTGAVKIDDIASGWNLLHS